MSDSQNGGGFAALFEQEQKSKPSGRARNPRVGERIEATVVRVGKDSVFVELDGKRQAYIDAIELRAPDGTLTVKVGDTLTANVVEVDNRTGNMRLGRTMAKNGGVTALEQARDAGIAVEGKVTAVNKGGLEVEVAGVRAFCPTSQADNRWVADANSFLGKTLRFLVSDVREGGRNILLSRRALLERESQEAASRALKDLTPGSTVRGTITGVRDFGAFVDLGGIEGLIPASEISHDRVVVADSLKAGDVVDVFVREVKPHTPTRQGEQTVKITLSLKALSADPWDGIEAIAPEGKVVLGTVTRVVDFGAFVRLAAGVEGLLHVSELGSKEKLTPGASLGVVVKKLDKTAHKISLVPAPEGMVAGSTVQGANIGLGAVLQGVVERIETYGAFVQLDGTRGRAGRGLVPNAELGLPRGADVRKLLPEGSKVTVKVLETGEGRLRLSIRAVGEDEERAEFAGYRDRAVTNQKLGSLGDLFKKKGLDAKKK